METLNKEGLAYLWSKLKEKITSGVSGVKGANETEFRAGNVNITKENIGLGNVENYKSVFTNTPQGLTEVEKLRARKNIGVPTFIFQTEEPATVPEDTVICVYE